MSVAAARPADRLAQRFAEGIAALQAEDWSTAIAALHDVTADPDLAAASDLADVRARACSLHAQALLESGRPHDAERPCREAIRILRGLRDRAGLTEVRALQDRIVKAIAHDAEQAQRLAEMQRVAATPLDALLAGASSTHERIEVLVRKAHAHADTGEPAAGMTVARQAVEEADAAGDVRQRVLARIAWSRTSPDEASAILVQAASLAGDAEEFNLVATVARAAEVAGVTLPRHPGAHAPRSLPETS